MNEMNPFQPIDTAQEALAELHATLAMMHTTGAVDDEGTFVENLIRQVQLKKIDPAEAVRRVRSMNENRSEYH